MRTLDLEMPRARPGAAAAFLGLVGCALMLGAPTGCAGDSGSDPLITNAGDAATSRDVGVVVLVPPPAKPACQANDDCPGSKPICVPPGVCAECATSGDCRLWETCMEGACLPVYCTPGDTQCVDDTLFRCADDGVRWIALPCAENRCVIGVCPECPNDTKTCDGQDVLVCTDAGYVAGATCPDDKICRAGECVDCTVPDALECRDGRVARCTVEGKWSVVQDCVGQGLNCIGGECSACEEGSRYCEDFEQWCLVDGKDERVFDCASVGLMCWEGACEPMCKDYDFKVGGFGNCADGVCCERSADRVEVVGEGICSGSGGSVVPWRLCEVPVCCERTDGALIDVGIGECNALKGQAVPLEDCAAEVCCNNRDGTWTQKAVGQCNLDGDVAEPVFCAPGDCCLTPDGSWQPLDGAACAAAGGTATSGAFCRAAPQLKTLTVQAEIEGTVSCDSTPWLVVPSSGNNKLVVYDLATKAKKITINTCTNPSRIAMGLSAELYASCRADGHVTRHELNGTKMWETALPECGSARGVMVGPAGRLFAACSAKSNEFQGPGSVHELDPVTGAVLNSVAMTSFVYGIAVDNDGIYAVHGWDSLTKIALGGAQDFTTLWTVQASYYGVAASGDGSVWIGGSALTRFDASDGSVLETYGVNGFVHGVTVGPGGLVYAAVPGHTDRIVVVSPGIGIVAEHVISLPNKSVHPKGAALDALGNIYSINQASGDVTKINLDGTLERFGSGQISSPYAYNGDLTGLTAACLLGQGGSWSSDPLDAGADTAIWLDVSWEATLPDGATLTLLYRVDGGPWKSVPFKGAFLGVIGRNLELRASGTSPGGLPVLLHTATARFIP